MPTNSKLKVETKATNVSKLQIENAELKRKNEELTDENTKLLTELEGITSDKQYAENAYNNAKGQIDYLKKTKSEETRHKDAWRKLYQEANQELNKIKSARLYKFFKWLGVW